MKVSNSLIWMKFIGICMVSLFLCVGCVATSQIKPEALTPTEMNITAKCEETVTVTVENGREFNAMKLPKLSNEALGGAVRDAIKECALFSEILPSGGRYALDLYVVNVSQPYAGSDMTAAVEIAWKLKDVQTGRAVWKESIQTENTVAREKAHAAIERIKLATESAAKDNIKLGIEKISHLDL